MAVFVPGQQQVVAGQHRGEDAEQMLLLLPQQKQSELITDLWGWLSNLRPNLPVLSSDTASLK